MTPFLAKNIISSSLLFIIWQISGFHLLQFSFFCIFISRVLFDYVIKFYTQLKMKILKICFFSDVCDVQRHKNKIQTTLSKKLINDVMPYYIQVQWSAGVSPFENDCGCSTYICWQGRWHKVLTRVDRLRCVKPTCPQILISPRISITLF